MNKIETLIYGGVAAAGIGVGFTVGYAVSKKRHEAIADAEIESVKETYSKAREAVIEKPDLTEVVPSEVTHATIKSASVDPDGLGYISVEAELGTEAPVESIAEEQEKFEAEHHNVFTKYGDAHDRVEAVETTVDDPEDQLEVTMELTKERDDAPYLISIDDFHDGTWDNHSKLSVTYFTQDNVLIDEREQIVPNLDEIIGKWALENFGNLSLDPEVVYVRNKKLKADFEVTRDGSSYQEQILGLKN